MHHSRREVAGCRSSSVPVAEKRQKKQALTSVSKVDLKRHFTGNGQKHREVELVSSYMYTKIT